MNGMGTPPDDDAALDGATDVDALFTFAYAELRRLASAVARRDPSLTLTPTALVHEAWLKLSRSPRFRATSSLHFKRVAARAMRQVLVEAARRRGASKRGGAAALYVTFDEDMSGQPSDSRAILALDDALEALSRVAPRQALLIESRFFGGLDVAETATLLNVSEATVLRDWRAARAWLGVQLAGTR